MPTCAKHECVIYDRLEFSTKTWDFHPILGMRLVPKSDEIWKGDNPFGEVEVNLPLLFRLSLFLFAAAAAPTPSINFRGQIFLWQHIPSARLRPSVRPGAACMGELLACAGSPE